MTSKAYMLGEAPVNFSSAGDVVLTLTSFAALAGRQSAQLDLGIQTTAKAFQYNWRAFIKFATAPVVGETIDIYMKTSDGTHLDNDDGIADGAVSAIDKLKNLQYVGSIIVDEASAVPEFSASGQVRITNRYIQFVFWNASADGLSATASDHGLLLEPWSIQGQAT